MITSKINAKYIEWLGASEMHQETLNWYSELNFIKDELLFFEDLIKFYTLQLIGSDYFEKSKDLVEKLDSLNNKTNLLLKTVKTHRNSLQILVDGVNQLNKEAAYKKEHKNLIVNLMEFKETYNQFKTELFEHIKNMIKKDNQKRLLE